MKSGTYLVQGGVITEVLMTTTLATHIVQTPDIAGGKPRIAGHRITVGQVAMWHELMGLSADEIATAYNLSLGDVYAALAYYFDNQQEIDLLQERNEQFVQQLQQATPSKLTHRRSV
jgi:uncharacterized protein (DUF433 family)